MRVFAGKRNRRSGSFFESSYSKDDKEYLSFSTPSLILDLTVPRDKSSSSAISVVHTFEIG